MGCNALLVLMVLHVNNDKIKNETCDKRGENRFRNQSKRIAAYKELGYCI